MPVYVATNLMESMVTSPHPTRAEVNDVYNTLIDGADGLVLAAETAIGAYPVASVSMVRRIIEEFDKMGPPRRQLLASTDLAAGRAPWRLPREPGGLLGQPPRAVEPQAAHRQAHRPDGLRPDRERYLFPLRGFMNKETLDSVLRTNRLPNGVPWTMPIVLQVDEDSVGDISVGDRIALSSEAGDPRDHRRGRDQPRSICARSPNRGSALRHWITRAWPGLRRVGPGSSPVRSRSSNDRCQSTSAMSWGPTRTRLIFSQKGWSRVIGFHTRNVPHRVHEFIQLRALDMVHADGLYISPVIGPKKSGDFLSGPILQSYQVLLESGVYPPGKVVLGVLHLLALLRATQAVFTAICRKNMGCELLRRDEITPGSGLVQGSPDARTVREPRRSRRHADLLRAVRVQSRDEPVRRAVRARDGGHKRHAAENGSDERRSVAGLVRP